MMMIRTFSDEILGLPGRLQPAPPPKEFSESGPAEQSEKQILAKVHEARKDFLTNITRNPLSFAKSCNSSLEMMNMDGDDYESTVASRATSAQSSEMDIMSTQSSVDEQRIARILQEYEDNRLNAMDEEDEWVGRDENGRRVTFNLQEYLYM